MSFTKAVPKKHVFRLRKNIFFRSARKKGSFHFIVQGGMQKNNFSEPENLSLSFTKETPEKTSGRVFFFGATADHAKPQPFCSQLTESKIAKFSRGKGPVAQWLERRSSRLKIAGSDPGGASFCATFRRCQYVVFLVCSEAPLSFYQANGQIYPHIDLEWIGSSPNMCEKSIFRGLESCFFL